MLAITAAAFVVACGGGDDTSTGQLDGIAQATRSTAALETTLTTIAPAALSTEEASSLVFMREEEKLARDVYAAMFPLWVGSVFQNIGAGEQVHMEAARLLRTRLEKDSRNHLRAFHDKRLRQGASYTPKCVTHNEHDAIVNSPKENG
ncbi:MAG: DUF2202 domain-containing protein [Rubrivivax sp.]|nr:DUF2202 domain-containing protein [Rubrivivax sp.]